MTERAGRNTITDGNDRKCAPLNVPVRFYDCKQLSCMVRFASGAKDGGLDMVLRQVLRAKIHMGKLTKTDLNYEGSIGIDGSLLTESSILPNEKVQVLNLNNGQRFETYVIEEEKNSGVIVLYGPAARCGQAGDRVCILAYAMVDDKELERIEPRKIVLDENNCIIPGE